MVFADFGQRVEQPVKLYCLLSIRRWPQFFFLFLGGLYFGVKKENTAMKEEDLDLITLLPKRASFQEDLHQVLTFIKEDFNALGYGTAPSFSSFSTSIRDTFF